MSEIALTRIDLLVHPDHHLKMGFSLGSSDNFERRRLWDMRTISLVHDPHVALIYFSTFLDRLEDGALKPQKSNKILSSEVARIDQERIERYKALLGDRFFLFGQERVSEKDLFGEIYSRGFIFNPGKTKLKAYGEYYELCVKGWGEDIREKLGIPRKNYTRARSLSLPKLEVIDRTVKQLEYLEAALAAR